ncbi:ATP-binding protein [Bordetella phage vB_BbrM_PHB04]|uniref:ATP-binding protein n=1 Tax=Bordetella phage vB_BbrM_PHB04 TaxID=2029657 RepID=A0A291LA07_9CAUD|nr:Dda-like helicase [Bordetella phage vB_BbrM_PHB04]ATI15730.1 ATP-binding protein [Bordetella phage vB_BbrM_PHB04]
MEWSGQQAAALKKVSAWLRDKKGKQVFRLFGYAGTGKTTLAMELAAAARGLVVFAAFTGKAALVLRSKGCENASTIHSLIYRLVDDGEGEPRFVLNRDSLASVASLIVIDEVSMVDEELGRDLLSYGTKVLVLGDPAQLPPVRGTGFFTAVEPDIMLTEIHRQARDNPIIHLSMQAREGLRLAPGAYGESRVITRAQLERQDVLEADQVLVGMNKTRRAYNARLRQLKGLEGLLPLAGDRMVCLRNNKDKGLLNGGIWTAPRPSRESAGIVTMEVESLDDPSITSPVEVEVPLEFFRGTEADLDWRKRRNHDEFDYGYALTVHKAQGSGWDEVMLFDESGSFRENRRQWLYTGVTRAAERITVVI